MEPRRSNEARALQFAMAVIVKRRGDSLQIVQRPDQIIRNAPAVDLLARSRNQLYAFEHTRIQTFAGQIQDEELLRRIFVPLEADFRGRLSARYSLIVPFGSSALVRVPHEKLRVVLRNWIFESADRLNVGQSAEIVPPGLSMRIVLRKEAFGKRGLLLSRSYYGSDSETEESRRENIRRALDAKVPKLAAASADGCSSVLVLESSDVAFGAAPFIADAVTSELNRSRQPDVVLLVESEAEADPWNLWVIKDGETYFADIQEAAVGGAHYLEERS